MASSWGTYPIAPFASTLVVVNGLPSTSTSPASGPRTPQIIEIVVVLPAPLGPRRPYVSPPPDAARPERDDLVGARARDGPAEHDGLPSRHLQARGGDRDLRGGQREERKENARVGGCPPGEAVAPGGRGGTGRRGRGPGDPAALELGFVGGEAAAEGACDERLLRPRDLPGRDRA